MMLKTLIGGVLIIVFTFSALASLPYEGVSNCTMENGQKKQAIEPYNNLNSSYLTDRECETIFVLPPKHGTGVISSYTLNGIAKQCEIYNMSRTNTIMLQTKRSKLQEAMTSNNSTELLKELTSITELLTAEDKILERFGRKVGLISKVYFETQWEDLVKEYQQLNPNFEVKRIPVVANVFNMDLTSTEEDITDLFSNTRKYSGLHSLTIPGVRLTSMRDLSKYIGIARPDPTSTMFGNSLTGTLQLNFHGMCPIYDLLKHNDITEKSFDDVNELIRRNNLDVYMAANATIWYPVQLAKNYKVRINIEATTDAAIKLTKEKTTFSIEAFTNALINNSSKKSIDIQMSSDNPTDASMTEELMELRERIISDIAVKLASTVGTPIKDSLKVKEFIGDADKLEVVADPHKIEWHRRSVCHSSRRWFKKRRHCYTQSYSVKRVVAANTTHVKKMISRIANSYNESVSGLEAVLRVSTIGFTKE